MTGIFSTSASRDILLYCLTATIAHFLMSLGQTSFHRYLGHTRLGGRFFHNHIQFHHGHYSGNHVVSARYLDNGDNNTLFFLLPVALIVVLSYFFAETGLVRGPGSRNVPVILWPLLYRQSISCYRVMAWPLFL